VLKSESYIKNTLINLQGEVMKVTKKVIAMALLAGVMGQSTFADDEIKGAAKFEAPKNSFGNKIYPFVPFSTATINERIRILSEDKKYINNFHEILSLKLNKRTTNNAINKGLKPWMSTFWPLTKGLIADPYKAKINYLRVDKELTWKGNHKRLVKREKTVHKNWKSLDQKGLDALAPSEKYDILIGDENFTLTNKVVEYMHKWGSKKENAFLPKDKLGKYIGLDIVGENTVNLATNYVNWGWVNGNNQSFVNIEEAIPLAVKNRGGLADAIAEYFIKDGRAYDYKTAYEMAIPVAIQEADNYVIKSKNSMMALWEGICHGWATAAGIVPRPERVVTVTLDDGIKIKFYPDDLKALASYMFANSLVQDSREYDAASDTFSGGGILMQGMRCNDKKPAKDPWGRFYDDKKDAFSDRLESRCVGVHPAIWHLGLVNIIGKQGRSFVVERKISEGVDNHPMHGYKAEYFNPYTGDYDGSTKKKISKITSLDQFRKFRNPEATHIVGVKLTMNYINWKRPVRATSDSPAKDEGKEIEMLYDLELNSVGDIVGGQWRATEVGRGNMFNAVRKQPDFFWVVTKDWKPFFEGRTDLPEWKDGSKAPPKEFKAASLLATDQKYYSTPLYGWHDRCDVERKVKTKLNKKLPKYFKVNCQHVYDKPQPLINIVRKLIKMSNRAGKTF